MSLTEFISEGAVFVLVWLVISLVPVFRVLPVEPRLISVALLSLDLDLFGDLLGERSGERLGASGIGLNL